MKIRYVAATVALFSLCALSYLQYSRTGAGNTGPVAVSGSDGKALPSVARADSVASSQALSSRSEPDTVSTSQAMNASPARTAPTVIGASAASANQFGENGPVRLSDIPAGRFHDEVAALSSESQSAVLSKLARLAIPLNDVSELNVDEHGMIFYSCDDYVEGDSIAKAESSIAVAASVPAAASTVQNDEDTSSVDISDPPAYHSNEGSENIIYLDFNGHSLSNTAWLSGASRECLPFDLDGDTSTFNAEEQACMESVWRRVAEDFAIFDVDVTTEEPDDFSTNTVIRALITSRQDESGLDNPSVSATGVAYIGVFGLSQGSYSFWNYYSPCFIYYDAYISAGYGAHLDSCLADTVSHESGHNLGLSHDGTSSSSYYYGHGTAFSDTSWSPIMGGEGGKTIVQWSKGEYYNANNTQDDIDIIGEQTGYADDNAGDSTGSATALDYASGVFYAYGCINLDDDVDVFSFTLESTTSDIVVSPYCVDGTEAGANVDVLVSILDSTGAVVESYDPSDSRSVEESLSLSAGTYYIEVEGTGTGSPLASSPSGYTSYGSLGVYALSVSGMQPGSIWTQTGWLTSSWYGEVYVVDSTGDGWIYSFDNYAWQYATGDSTSDVWFFDNSLSHWFWTSESAYPYYFVYQDDGSSIWALYLADQSDESTRYYYVWDDGGVSGWTTATDLIAGSVTYPAGE